MHDDPNIISKLRDMFMEGCTPSKLIHYLSTCFPQDSLFEVVQGYFQNAFDVFPTTVPIHLSSDQMENEKLAHLNHKLIHSMIQTYPKWGAGTTATPFWRDISATNMFGSIKSQSVTLPSNIQAEWDNLSDEVQQYITKVNVASQVLYEKVRILSFLAERLQSQATKP